MSKIGRKPINISGTQVEVKGQAVHYKGPKASGVYNVPPQFAVTMKDNKLSIQPAPSKAKSLKPRDINREWGLHRALLANQLMGSKQEFEKVVEIVGLGYKAVKTGDKLTFTLGYSHKIDFPIPKGVSVSVDKTGQKITVTSSDKVLLGEICSKICDLRRPEAYKGTGVKLSTEQIFRKEAKGK
jgi:large subunit ribosomal protein L6